MPAATPAAAAQAAAEAIEAVDAEVGGTVTTDGVLVVNHANGTAWFTITVLPGGERFRVTVAREIAELPPFHAAHTAGGPAGCIRCQLIRDDH
jgi:hypothetical protein